MSTSVNEDGIEVVTLSDSEEEAGGVNISVEEPDAMSTSDTSSPLLPASSDESEEEEVSPDCVPSFSLFLSPSLAP
jgi:hypothetical protein